ncbi:MAG: hypothetical protein FWH51_05620, partial [Dehalococcoidia bacterium]|nr:hypothetical protein [Dehalococcoidia bacterium]
CASIIAKVTRDRLMVELDQDYPGYGLARHKGYATRAHYDALAQLGLSPLHRRTFCKSVVLPACQDKTCTQDSLLRCSRVMPANDTNFGVTL